MRVTERLMRAGSFDFTLTDATPGSILDEVRGALGFTGDTSAWDPPDGHIVVVPAWQPVGGVSLSQAIYTGRLMMQTGKRGFTGKGLAAWLGGDQTPAQFRIGATTHTAKTLSELVDQVFTSGRDGGLTKGTVTSPAGTKTVRWAYTTPIEYLDHVSFIHGTQWRINPDGTLDAATPANLFNTTPTVVIVSRDLTALQAGSVTVMPGEFASPQIDASHIIYQARAYGEGEGAASIAVSAVSASGTRLYDFAGDAWNGVRIPLDLQSETTSGAGSALEDAATEAVATYEYPRVSFDSIQVRHARTREHIEPGDSVYIADDGSGLYDSTNSVVVHGEVMNPLKLTVQRMTWDVPEGYGIYLRRHSGTETFTDLTPYVELTATEDAVTDLEVGDFQGVGDAAALQGHARFWPALVERLLR